MAAGQPALRNRAPVSRLRAHAARSATASVCVCAGESERLRVSASLPLGAGASMPMQGSGQAHAVTRPPRRSAAHRRCSGTLVQTSGWRWKQVERCRDFMHLSSCWLQKWRQRRACGKKDRLSIGTAPPASLRQISVRRWVPTRAIFEASQRQGYGLWFAAGSAGTACVRRRGEACTATRSLPPMRDALLRI